MSGCDRYDKWGNPILPNGMRLKGELLADESVRRVLAPVMDRFTPHVKAPRTFHLPWSPGKTKDDRVLTDLSGFEGREVVVTVKMDGENTSIYGKDGFIHARSVEPMSPHPSRDRVKALGCNASGVSRVNVLPAVPTAVMTPLPEHH